MKTLPKFCAVLIFVFSLLQLHADPAGLVSHWQAESNALDTLNHNHGTTVGGVTYASGAVGSAFSLNGSAFVSVTNPTFNAYSNGFTVMAWIKIAAYNQAPSIMNLRTPPNSSGFTLEQWYNNPGSILFAVNQTGVSEGFSTLTSPGWQLNTFYHIAATFDAASGTMALYRDGIQVAFTNNLPHTNMATVSNPSFEIGRNIVAGLGWNGLIDDARFYDHALTAAEIASLATGGQKVTLFAVAQNVNVVYRFQLGPVGAPVQISSISNALLNVPTGLTISSNGELFVVNIDGPSSGNGGAGSICRFINPAGAPVFNGIITNGFNTPVGATFRGNELLVVDAWNNRVRRYTFNNAGVPGEIASITNGLNSNAPRFVFAAPGGNEVFVSQCCGPNEVRRYLINGGGTVVTNGTITSGLANPHGMAFSASGELFIVNAYGPSISRFTFSNGVALANGTISGNGLGIPIGVAFSPWGEMFVVNQSGSVLSRWTFTSNGVAVANGTFNVPSGLTDLAFVSAIGVETVFQPFCTNLTVTLSAAITNCVVSTNYTTNATIVVNNLVDWLKADNNAVDSSGNGNTANPISVGYEAGQFGQAFSISEAAYAVENANARRVDLGPLTQLYSATGLTVSAWIKIPTAVNPAASNNQTYIFTHPAQLLNATVTNVVSYGLFIGPSVTAPRRPTYGIGFHDGTEAIVGSAVAFPENQWVHLAVTWSSASGLLRMYRNGVLDGSTSSAGLGKTLPTATQRSPLGPAFPAELGVWDFVSDTNPVIARYGGAAVAIDDFRLYNRALATNEIQLIYNGEPPVITNTVITNCTPVSAVTTNLDFCTTPAGKLKIFKTLPNVELRWSSFTNAYYLLQGSDALAPINWTNVWGIGPGNGTNLVVPEVTTPRPRRFYRLLSTEP